MTGSALEIENEVRKSNIDRIISIKTLQHATIFVCHKKTLINHSNISHIFNKKFNGVPPAILKKALQDLWKEAEQVKREISASLLLQGALR